MRRDGGPSTKTRRGASDWGSETRHAAGEQWGARCTQRSGKSLDRDSTAFSLCRRLQGGSELSSDLPLDPPRAIVAAQTQSWTRCADFERMGASAPDNIGASDSVAGWSETIWGLDTC